MEPIDFVQKNIEMTENWLDAQLDRKFQNNQINQNRAEVYKQRRKEAIEEKQKRDVMHLHKWDFIRQRRDEQTAIALEKKRQKNQLRQWYVVLRKDKMVRKVAKRFKDKLEEIALDKKQRESVARIERVVQRMKATIGKDLSERSRRQVRNTLTVSIPMRLELYREPASHTIHSFLVRKT